MRANQYIQGYTLIEVLVAMVILAMSLTVLFRVFATGLRNVDVSADYARAVIIAETQLAEMGVSESLVRGEFDGSVDERFYWTRTVEEYFPFSLADYDVLPVGAYQVTVAVEWQNAERTREIRLSTIRLQRGNLSGDNT